jgi:glycerol-3-phosphate dehydrogenase
VNPRRGQFVVYDRNTRPLVRHILLPVPTKQTKGKLLAPTIFGNLLAGPTAEDLPLDAADQTWTTLEGLAEVRAAAERFCPSLRQHLPIAVYAGARCNCRQGSYVIRVNDGHAGIVTVTGIRSTGLSSSPALADHLLERMQRECGLVLRARAGAIEARPEESWPGWWRRPWEDAARVAARPDYGRLVCACEMVSRGEIADALDSPLEPRTLDAVKRRTRALTGRCQGFHCAVAIAEVVGERRGVAVAAVTKRGPGSEIGGASEPR